MQRYFALVTLLVTSYLLSAQDEFQAGLFIGASNYQGDFVVEDYAFLKESNLSVGLHFRKGLNKVLVARGSVSLVNLTGTDENYPERAERDFSFKNTLIELAAGLEFEPLGARRYRSSVSRNQIFSPYLFAGVGVAYMNPQPKLNYTGGPGEDPAVADDINAEIEEVILTVPFGVGLSFDVDANWSIALEGGLRATFTDYLDGLSLAGNPDKNDWFQVIGLRMLYRFDNK